VAAGHGHPPSIFSAPLHAPTVIGGTPRSHHGGLAERPGARRGPDDRTAEGRRQGRRAWRSLAARPRPSALRGCPVRADAHLLRSMRRHAPASVGRDRLPASRPRSRSSTPGDRLRGALGSVPPRAFRSRRGLLVSDRASHEVPGFGALALPSALGRKALRSPRRSQGSRRPTSGCDGDPASAAAATCWRAKCRAVVISTIYKGTRGPEPCRPGRGILWGVFGDRSSGRCLELTDIGDCRGRSGGVGTAEALRSASIEP